MGPIVEDKSIVPEGVGKVNGCGQLCKLLWRESSLEAVLYFMSVCIEYARWGYLGYKKHELMCVTEYMYIQKNVKRDYTWDMSMIGRMSIGGAHII